MMKVCSSRGISALGACPNLMGAGTRANEITSGKPLSVSSTSWIGSSWKEG